MNWYISRGLAEIISQTPPSFMLKFKPKGVGSIPGGPLVRKNICVVCGCSDNLTKHHVVPKCYIKYYPREHKERNSKDILVMCRKHHAEYETKAYELRQEMAVEFDAPIENWVDTEFIMAAKALSALVTYGDKIPQERAECLNGRVYKYLKKTGTTKLDLMSYSFNQESHSKKVVTEICRDGIIDFSNRWRRHFIETMRPQYLPDDWKDIGHGFSNT
jgi:hypothetical protein